MLYQPTREKPCARKRGWILESQLAQSPKARAVQADIIERLLQHEREGTLPRSPRGLFYDLRPNGMPDNPRGCIYMKRLTDKRRSNMQVQPSFVTNELLEMRRVYNPETGEFLIDEDWIADARAPNPLGPSEVDDADEAAQNVVRYLTHLYLARQAGQPVYLELCCEAEGLMMRLRRVALPYGVWVYSGSGFDGLKAKKAAAERAAGRDVPTLVGHIADFDRHGGDIRDAFAEDVIEWMKFHREQRGARGSFDVTRLALTRKQAEKHDLLDENGKAEVEGLPVQVMDEIVREFIESNLDPDIARKVVENEPAMRSEAARIVAQRLRRRHGANKSDDIDLDDPWSWAR
jgi:hypothetical protein